MRIARRGIVGLVGALGLLAASAGPAAAGGYTFTRVADSVADGLDPNNFGCATINDPGAIAFRAGRLADDGFNTVDGIYRVTATGTRIRTIVENEKQFDFIGVNPSMNDLGVVSFAARLSSGDEIIARANARKLTVVANTRNKFNFFGFDTSINNDNVVAFRAELDEEFGFDEGLFSGSGGRVTTHFFTSTSDFDGSDSRPSINDAGRIAFVESIDFTQGVFATDGAGGFVTIASADPERGVAPPVLNNAGTAALRISYFDEAADEFVEAIVTGSGGPLTTVVDTLGPFGSFGFRPPSLNDNGDVAFLATLDDFLTTGIFVGPDPVAHRVIATGDTLDGATVTNLVFCEEGLNDSGQLTFVATLEDPSAPEGFRVAVFRATPSP